jgi:predicted amidohydrolase YtcJ
MTTDADSDSPLEDLSGKWGVRVSYRVRGSSKAGFGPGIKVQLLPVGDSFELRAYRRTPENVLFQVPVIASMQPDHMAMTDRFEDNPYLVRYNERQKKYAWALKSVYDSGAHLSFGTDSPVTVLDPFVTIYRAVTRLANDGEPKGGWNPEQKMKMEDVLHCYTLEGYYAVGREHELGTLEEHKYADFIVLDRNLLTISPDAIRDTKVLLTVVNGKDVFER